MRNSFENRSTSQQIRERSAKFFKSAKPASRSSNQHRTQPSFDDENSSFSKEQSRLSYKGVASRQSQENIYPNKKLSLSKTEKSANQRYKKEKEEELSSLSGFTASDNEDEEINHLHMRNVLRDQKKKQQLSDNEDRDLETESHDVVALDPEEDLKRRFEQHEISRKKNEQEKRQREILASKNIENLQNIQNNTQLKRPHSSHGALRTADNMTLKNSVLHQNENMHPERPQTAAVRIQVSEVEKKPALIFKPVYKKGIQQSLIEKKSFNYTDKKFKTIARKSDPVSRFSAFQSEWNKTKILKGDTKGKEGRKLNLAERNQTSKPDFVFHRYQSKFHLI